jgi:FAD synthase
LVEYLRPEAVFPDLPTFLDQMAADCVQARDILTAL